MASASLPTDDHGSEEYVWVRTSLLTGGGRTSTTSVTSPRRAASSVTSAAGGADEDKAANDWGWVRSRLLSDGALEALALQSNAGATSAAPKKRLVVLLSRGVSDRTQKSNQQHALSILAARETPYEEVDGMDPTQKERREMLFGVSKIRGNYPQFFLVHSAGGGSKNEKTTYKGNYHWIHELNDTVDLPQDILAANPDLETWDRVLGDCEHFEGGAGGGDADNGMEMRICVDDELSPHHNAELTVSSAEISRGNIVMANSDPPEDIDGSTSEHFADDDDDEYVSAGAKCRKRELSRYYPDDLITLTHLHEPAVVHCLRKRYDIDLIYTATGPILLAINPFKTLRGTYSEETMQLYFERGEKGPSVGVGKDGGYENHNDLSPHIYGLADRTYRDMMVSLELVGGGERRLGGSSDFKVNQSILVSGESGAGKTVSTKFIMQYLAALSKRSSNETPTSGDSVDASNNSDIEQQVLQSNPILESFGNARTIRNDNSSRFGKYVQIQFSNRGALVGASIETYLLEKVRIITQSEGERNYHIFYELLQGGLQEDELKKHFLSDFTAEDFRITSCSGTFDRRDGVLDEETFADLIGAFETVGFSTKERADVVAAMCALLHLSNLSLLAVSADESEIDKTNVHLAPALSLLGFTIENLNRGLCYFAIQAGKEHHTRSLSKEKAEKGLEALVKALYAAVFDFLVARINSSIAVDASDSAKRGRGGNKSAAAAIGVLDIFGFESFDTNSFEQLCINYTNEALQQQFNNFVLKVEQEEYKREGIGWAFVDFPDNQDVLDLIGKKGSGIIPVLDDMCKAVGMTDSTFCHAIYQKCESHPRFVVSLLQKGSKCFAIQHYAGAVEYDTQTGWVEKDRDEVPKFTLKLLKGSSNTFVKSLGDIIGGTDVASVIGGAKKSRRAPPKSGNNGPSAVGKRPTVGAQFSQQLAELRAKIDLTSPHYARCIKPNDALMPDHFDPAPVVDQLRCNGVIEAIRVSRLGYPQRFTHSLFARRYRILGIKAMKDAKRSARRQRPVDIIVQAISDEVKEDEIKGMQVGRSKVFLRQATYDTIERLRSLKIRYAAITIQREARRYVAERDYHIIHWLATKLQCFVRRYLAVAKFGRMLLARKVRCAITIQAYSRKYIARRQFQRTVTSSVLVQSVMRKHKARKSFVTQKQSATAIQATMRGNLAAQRVDNLRQIREADEKAKADAKAKAAAIDAERELNEVRELKAPAVPPKLVENDVGISNSTAIIGLMGELPQAPPVPTVDSAELISMSQEREQLRMEVDVKKSIAKNTKDQLEEIIRENSKLKAQADLVVSLQDENREMARVILSLKASLAEKDSALNDAAIELKVSERDLASTKKSLEESKAECQELKFDISKVREKGDKSAEDLSQRYAELANITQAMLRKDSEINDLKAHHEKTILKKEKQIKKLQKEAEQEDATIFSLNRENADLKSEMETKDNDAEEEIENLKATIAKLKSKAKKYDKLQDDSKTVFTNYKDELTALREVNEILRNDVERWEAKATGAEEEAKQLKEQSDMELKSFTNALERMEELRANTEQELVDARLNIGDLEAEQRLCTCKFEREALRKPEPLNSWVIICPSLVTVIPSEGNS